MIAIDLRDIVLKIALYNFFKLILVLALGGYLPTQVK